MRINEQRDKKAIGLVETVKNVLERVKTNPMNIDLHDPQTGGRYMGHYLSDAANILMKLYECSDLKLLSRSEEVPDEVKEFLKDTEEYRTESKFGYTI